MLTPQTPAMGLLRNLPRHSRLDMVRKGGGRDDWLCGRSVVAFTVGPDLDLCVSQDVNPAAFPYRLFPQGFPRTFLLQTSTTVDNQCLGIVYFISSLLYTLYHLILNLMQHTRKLSSKMLIINHLK